MTLVVCILALWGLGLILLFRIPVCATGGARPPYPTLSVIVPARNEERNLPTLLDSLAEQDLSPSEVIVVDDDSTDSTARLAREAGARVIASKPLPAGWRGKTWACLQGAEAAAGEVLLFVDADTFFESGGLRRILDTYLEERGIMSVGAYHSVKCAYEQLSAFFNLIMTAGTGAFTILGRKLQPAGLFGQFLMLDRRTYFECGGHTSVKDKILENFYLAEVFRRSGTPMRCYGGKGTFSMRMYPEGLHDLIEGWSKAFATGAAQTPLPTLLMIIGWITGAFTSVVVLLIAAFIGSFNKLALGGILYLLFALQTWSMLIRIGAFRFYTALLYPISLLFYIAVFGRSLMFVVFKKKVSWKGRQMDPESPGKRAP
jgi:4,4'-diaponeurosporenoate glycosyltransferase